MPAPRAFSDRPIRLAHLAGQPAPSVLPLYRQLAADPRVDFTVLYGSSEGVRAYDDGYGTPIAWDADMTSGYRHVFLRAAHRTPGLGTRFWATRNWDVVPILLHERYDALWMAGYYSATYLMAALAQRAAGGAVLFREEQTTLDRRSFANTVTKQLIVRPYLRLGWGLYISRENRRWLESFGMPSERLFEAPYTVDNERLAGAAAELAPKRAELRAALGVPQDGGPVIATASRLIAKKQPAFLLEAFRRVRTRLQCTLLIVGSGPLEEELRAQVARDGIEDVVFAGFLNRSEIARAYAAADVFTLLSSEKETFGLVVGEAMNFGLPIVVSDRVGCGADLVSTGYNGFVVSAHDPADATAALERLVADPSLRQRMGIASRERIDGWNPARSAEGIIAAASAAAAARGRRS
ncbi:MAG: glycosyltransferase family 4 protein [Solirubrobacteraceae bacterium]